MQCVFQLGLLSDYIVNESHQKSSKCRYLPTLQLTVCVFILSLQEQRQHVATLHQGVFCLWSDKFLWTAPSRNTTESEGLPNSYRFHQVNRGMKIQTVLVKLSVYCNMVTHQCGVSCVLFRKFWCKTRFPPPTFSIRILLVVIRLNISLESSRFAFDYNCVTPLQQWLSQLNWSTKIVHHYHLVLLDNLHLALFNIILC